VSAGSQTPAGTGPAYQAFGAFVRSQRELARLTLRQASELARISNPYLSQIEHGLSLPSITVLGALADALSVSVETLLLQAAGVTPGSTGSSTARTEDAIRQDARISSVQKLALLTVLASFTGEQPPTPGQRAPEPAKPPTKTARARKTIPTPRTKRSDPHE
jgi:transcriptional regulator with XRE-family HTH domain